MAILPPSVGPRAAITDLIAFMRQRSREQVLGLIMAVLVTTIILIVFIVDAKVNTAPPPRIVYIESFGPDRTDADIIKDQKEAAVRKHQAAEAKKADFRKLEKQLGL